MSNFRASNFCGWLAGLKLKEIFWPIKRSEFKLFLPLALLMFCVLFNFAALRSIKDSLVVPNIGAEAISFLKLWLVLPATIIFTLIYAKLSNILNYKQLFYLIISSFLLVFFLFTYLLFPNQDFYHPSQKLINQLIISYPNFKWFLYIAGKWSYALMYIFCELWSVVIINLLFWQFANNIFDTDSAKRFYPFLGVIGNLGMILAGSVLVNYSDFSLITDQQLLINYASDNQIQCNMVLKPVINTILLAGFLAICLYYYINEYVLSHLNWVKLDNKIKAAKKTSLSIRQSINLLLKSRYIGHIVLLILCYGLVINILEGPWKYRITQLYPNTIDYLNFMGKFNIWMGISSVIFMIIGSNILRYTSWLCSALITPLMLFCTGFIFFLFIILATKFSIFDDHTKPIYFAVIIGAIQNILSKSTKYSLFDSTKEMAYIPLSLELRTKGKAAVEVIGLKFGKSLGAFVQSLIFISVPAASFDSITLYLLVIIAIIIMLWIWNIFCLNKEYLILKERTDRSCEN